MNTGSEKEYVIEHGSERGTYLTEIFQESGRITTTWRPDLKQALVWTERHEAEDIAEKTRGGRVREITPGTGGKRFKGIRNVKAKRWEDENNAFCQFVFGEVSRWSSIRVRLGREAMADRLFLKLADASL